MLDEAKDFKEQVTELRRQQILLGAAQVFAEKGFHKATTKEIARAAGIAEGTIYNYFGNKRELLVSMIELIAIRSLESVLADHPPDDPREFFAAILRDRHQLAQDYGHLMLPLLAEIFTDQELREALYRQLVIPITGHVEKYIQAQVDAGRFRPVNPIIVTRAMMGTMMINFALKLTHLDSRYEDISTEAMFEQISSLFLQGLFTDKND